MRRLAVTASDGVLLNWLTPRAAADQTAALHEIAPDARVALYVRWALEPAARARLDDVASRYDQAPGYAGSGSAPTTPSSHPTRPMRRGG